MEKNSTRTLAVAVTFFFFASSLSGVFLPIYYVDAGMSISDIIIILLFTFILAGLLPTILMYSSRNFERLISLGILTTVLFYVALIYVKNPVFLGLAYGLSMATFWPSFNLLQFRLSETGGRAFLISVMWVGIPSLTGIFGSAVGGFVVETFGFLALFLVSIALYMASFVFSLKIRCKPEVQRFSVPRNMVFVIFMITFVLWGWSESYWLAYPLFVRSVSSSILQTGLIFAASSLIMTFANLSINKLSDIKGTRVEFAVTGSILYALWYFAIAYASTAMEIVVLSFLSGFATAFSISWFAYYGDSFGREHYATILVMMEVGFMIGRILNLAPTYFYITAYDYTEYLMLLGVVSLFLIPFYFLSKKVKSGN